MSSVSILPNYSSASPRGLQRGRRERERVGDAAPVERDAGAAVAVVVHDQRVSAADRPRLCLDAHAAFARRPQARLRCEGTLCANAVGKLMTR